MLYMLLHRLMVLLTFCAILAVGHIQAPSANVATTYSIGGDGLIGDGTWGMTTTTTSDSGNTTSTDNSNQGNATATPTIVTQPPPLVVTQPAPVIVGAP